MEEKRRSSGVFLDVLLLALIMLPIAFCIVLQILTKPETAGITVEGARIYFTINMPIQPLHITESQVNSWAVLLSIFFLCLYLTRNLKVRNPSKRQHLAEWIVEKTENLVKGNMDPYFKSFGPFIAAILGLSAFSSLLSLFGLYPPTSDINIVGGWAILVFILILNYKLKCGPLHYIKSLSSPVLLTPLNIISEVATPVSMAFRHYGNILSGTVISVLVAAGLQGLSSIVLGWLPGFLGEIPLLRIGLPAVLSIYFDVFSGCLQAFIFAMLTMMYISDGFPAEDFAARRAKIKKQKN